MATPSMAGAEGQDERLVQANIARAQLDFVSLWHYKDQLGYGALDYYYYKKRIGNVDASVQSIGYPKDVERMFQYVDSSEERKLRVNESNDVTDADTSNDESFDEYKDWLQDKDPDCVAYNRGQAKPTEVRDESNGSSATLPSQWPTHARNPKQTTGSLKGLAAVAKRSKIGSQKLKMKFSENVGGPCGDNRRTFVDEVVLFTKQKAPLIGVRNWKDVCQHVKDDIAISVMVCQWPHHAAL
ncbi:hypothetical protein SETIT_9G296500v2 [Setaria italica]|uniref:Uncharacterized protein n=1 Tax=Setaria italica TaxID=4555 RepID=A0A368SM15_SETIT|nr:hypothetical protein SETIT_9G296500v2 [Setaria italica]